MRETTCSLKRQKQQLVVFLGLLSTALVVYCCVLLWLCTSVYCCGFVYRCVLCTVVVVYCWVLLCTLAMDGVSEDDLCWLQLEDFRMLLIKNIEPSRITPYLRQCQVLLCTSPTGCSLSSTNWFFLCQVITAEDEEQLFNDPALVVRRRKVGKQPHREGGRN